MDEAFDSPADGESVLPHGFAVHNGAHAAHGWCEVIPLADSRLGVSLGHCADRARSARMRADIRAVLRSTSDPVRALDGLVGDVPNVVCAVIDSDASRLDYSSVGQGVLVLAGPDLAGRQLDPARGRLGGETLPPGSTLLAHAGGRNRAGVGLPNDFTTMHLERAADQVIAHLASSGPDDGVEVLLYRHPPEDLKVTVPAEPASLAVVRGQLRRWLAIAGVDPEVAADALLAVGEAASNSTEHSVVGVGHDVEMNVRASISQGRLRFEVSDNGRWKPAAAFPGHRGHGLRLIKALVDTADLTATDVGTTVEMLKELSQ